MSKTTKRVALALVLLCLSLGGVVLYGRRSGTGSSGERAGPPSTPIAAAPAPAIAPPPAPVAMDPPAARAPAPEGKIRSEHKRTEALREPSDERRPEPEKTVVAMELAADAGSSEVAAAAAPSSEEPAVVAPTPPPKKLGDIAIRVRPKLGVKVQAFQIVKMVAFVDSEEIVAIDDKTFWQGKPEIDLWKGRLPAGEYVLKVAVDYHGNGHSVFSYFDSYHYAVNSSTRFQLQEGARLEMMIDLVDKGGVNTAFDKRLQIAFAQQ